MMAIYNNYYNFNQVSQTGDSITLKHLYPVACSKVWMRVTTQWDVKNFHNNRPSGPGADESTPLQDT